MKLISHTALCIVGESDAILVRNALDITLKSVQSDEEGRFLCLETIIQDQLFLLVNIYAPNTSTEQTSFFRKLSDLAMNNVKS